MAREISAGGVVLHKVSGAWSVAAIEPRKDDAPADSTRRKTTKTPLALPKGLVDPGEKPEQTALREVREETGIVAIPITKLTDIKYVYVRSWGDRERVYLTRRAYLQ